jgi:hypothetical protein
MILRGTTILFSFLLLFLSFSISTATINTIQEGIQSNSWPSTEAIIIESFVVNETHEEIFYYAIVRYQYEIVGEVYIGTNNFDMRNQTIIYSSPAQPQQIVDRFNVGEFVEIYYDPSNFSRSTMKTGILLESVFPQTIFFLIFTTIGLIGIYYSLIRKNDESQESILFKQQN